MKSNISTKSVEAAVFRSQSELLQQLSEVGGLGELSADPGQLVEDGTVQGHTGDLALSTAAAVPADLKHKHAAVRSLANTSNDDVPMLTA